jgi:4,5-DOPA dioxygenase extradiol
MLAIDTGNAALYRALGQSLPLPKAVLVVSAHWETDHLQIGEIRSHQRLIYDFMGFPESLYQLQYPAPGAPWLAERLISLFPPNLAPVVVERGLDHGVWVPFLHLWPEADVPVLQISLPRSLSESELLELGARLAVLRSEGVLIIGSGNVTHNLARIDPRLKQEPIAWAAAFDAWVAEVLQQHDMDRLCQWRQQAPHALLNHPSPEHFLPLFVATGAAVGEAVSFPIEGFELGCISRRTVLFGANG